MSLKITISPNEIIIHGDDDEKGINANTTPINRADYINQKLRNTNLFSLLTPAEMDFIEQSAATNDKTWLMFCIYAQAKIGHPVSIDTTDTIATEASSLLDSKKKKNGGLLSVTPKSITIKYADHERQGQLPSNQFSAVDFLQFLPRVPIIAMDYDGCIHTEDSRSKAQAWIISNIPTPSIMVSFSNRQSAKLDSDAKKIILQTQQMDTGLAKDKIPELAAATNAEYWDLNLEDFVFKLDRKWYADSISMLFGDKKQNGKPGNKALIFFNIAKKAVEQYPTLPVDILIFDDNYNILRETNNTMRILKPLIPKNIKTTFYSVGYEFIKVEEIAKLKSGCHQDLNTTDIDKLMHCLLFQYETESLKPEEPIQDNNIQEQQNPLSIGERTAEQLIKSIMGDKTPPSTHFQSANGYQRIGFDIPDKREDMQDIPCCQCNIS